VTGRPVHSRIRSGEGAALHLSLAAGADLVLVAPATADFLARAAHGRADDLLATILLATRAPVVLAPAMNDRMYSHTQTQRNLAYCRDELGYRIAGPGVGPLAVGEGEGPGRMLEPRELVDHAGRALGGEGLRGRGVLVTAGPTREPLDPVRFLGNRSSGRMGFALAREAFLRGADVTLVTGPSALEDPTGVRTVRVESARDMLSEVKESISNADIVLYAAAVADFRPVEPADRKIKRGNGRAPSVALEENPDIAIETLRLRRKGSVALGFALETEEVRRGALDKLRKKGFDLIVSNDPGEPGAGFDVPTNRVNVFDRDGGEEELPLLTKEALASVLFDRVEVRLNGTRRR
jgi:phosphopantothenoylcysteine decarboxylase/phosphopantothenate--cysteine ligase